MRSFLIALAIFSFFNGLAQQDVVISHKSDTLISLPAKDTIYAIPFTVLGTKIGSVPVVTIRIDTGSDAKKDVDYNFRDNDSVPRDSLSVNAKGKTGKFLLCVGGGQTNQKKIWLSLVVKDSAGTFKIRRLIVLKPYVKPAPMPAPEPKDSLLIRLTRDLDVPVQGRMDTIRKHFLFWKWNRTKPNTVNIEKVLSRTTADGKYYFTVITAEREIFSNTEGIVLNGQPADTCQVFLDTNNKVFLKLKDFLIISNKPKGSETHTLTPQNRTIAVPKQ